MAIHFAIRPYNVILEGEGAATAPTGDAPCPGLVRQNAAAKMTDFIELLEMVDDEGAEARGLGLGLMSTNGNIHYASHAGRSQGRLLAHTVYNTCASIDAYQWQRMGRRQPTAPQETPSVPGTIAEEVNGADQVRPPRAQLRLPVARKATKKCKALEFLTTKVEVKLRRRERRRNIAWWFHDCSRVMSFTELSVTARFPPAEGTIFVRRSASGGTTDCSSGATFNPRPLGRWDGRGRTGAHSMDTKKRSFGLLPSDTSSHRPRAI